MIGWAIGIVGFVISYFCKKEWLDYVLWFEVAIQGIQVIIIACSIKKNKLLGIPLTCIVYLLGSTAIVLLALPLTVIAIAVAIGIMILCFLAKADTGNSCSSDSRSKGTLIDGPNGPFIQIDSGGSVNVVEVYANMVRDQNNESWHLHGTSVVKM